jgi:hypothetical protein
VPLEVVSTQLLQSSGTDREAERERRRKNGNVPPREGKAGGKNLDQTCLRLAIERPGTTSGGRATVHYFCIACDKFRANNSRSRAFEHADQCNVSITTSLSSVSFDELEGLTNTIETRTRMADFSQRSQGTVAEDFRQGCGIG